MSLIDKGRSAIADAPTVCLTNAGSQVCASQVSDPRAKLLALFHAFGGKPCLVRWDDGRTMILSAEALRVVDIPLTHGGMNA